MTAPMTPERLSEIRAQVKYNDGSHGGRIRNPVVDELLAEVDRLQAQATVWVGKHHGFQGCTERDAAYCACGTDVDPECEGCGEPIEDGEQVVTVTRPGLPTISPDSLDQWWDTHLAHMRCSLLSVDEVHPDA